MPIANLQSIIHKKLPEALAALVVDEFGSTAAFGESIVIRRGVTSLAAQSVRLVHRTGSATIRNSDGAERHELTILVVGAPALDIEVDDRFNDSNGQLYEVSFIRPNSQIQKVAEARAVT